jgi:hypothetical protein
MAQATGTILRRSNDNGRIVQSRRIAKGAALFWDRGPSPRDSVTSPPTTYTFALHAGSSGGSQFHRSLWIQAVLAERSGALFLAWRFWRQQVPVLLRVKQELFKAFSEFEASGNSAPASPNHFVVRSDTWIGRAGSALVGFLCAPKSVCNVSAQSLEHDAVPPHHHTSQEATLYSRKQCVVTGARQSLNWSEPGRWAGFCLTPRVART